jgi:hypothetical protein
MWWGWDFEVMLEEGAPRKIDKSKQLQSWEGARQRCEHE